MKNILVIDDDDQVRSLLGAILRRKGYAVAEAEDGYAGIKHCRGNQVDLVIKYILMPEHDGIKLLLQIKKTVPHIKVVVISGAVGRSHGQPRITEGRVATTFHAAAGHSGSGRFRSWPAPKRRIGRGRAAGSVC